MWRNGIKCDTLRHIGEIIHFHPNLFDFALLIKGFCTVNLLV